MGVELRNASFTQFRHHHVSHSLAYGHLSGISIDIDETDAPDLFLSGLGQHFLETGEQKPEWVFIDHAHEDNRVRIFESTEEGFVDGLVESVGDRPHRMQVNHFTLQRSIQVDQDIEVIMRGVARGDRHDDLDRFDPNIRLMPQTVTSHIASTTILIPIFDLPLVRSVKLIGISTMVSPIWSARHAIST